MICFSIGMYAETKKAFLGCMLFPKIKIILEEPLFDTEVSVTLDYLIKILDEHLNNNKQ